MLLMFYTLRTYPCVEDDGPEGGVKKNLKKKK
jgi:hypothetical protein